MAPALSSSTHCPRGAWRVETLELCRLELILGHSPGVTRLQMSRASTRVTEGTGRTSGPGRGEKADTTWGEVLRGRNPAGAHRQAGSPPASGQKAFPGRSRHLPLSVSLSAALEKQQRTFLVPSVPLTPHDAVSGPTTLPWPGFPQTVGPDPAGTAPLCRLSPFGNGASGESRDV